MARTIILILFICFSFISSAQSVRQLNDSSFITIAYIETSMLKDSLQLDTIRLTQLDSINVEYYGGIASLGKHLTADERIVQISLLNDRRLVSLKTVLTGEQYIRFLEVMDNRKHRKPI